MKQALGLVEAIGLATAIEATDAMVKSANVKLLGLESTRGDGMHVIKVVGDVGAVKAACEAGSAACSKGRGVFSVKIIPRPADRLEPFIYNSLTIGYENTMAEEDIYHFSITPRYPMASKIVKAEVEEETTED